MAPTMRVSLLALFFAIGCANGPDLPPTTGQTENPANLPTPDFNGGFNRDATAAYFEPAAGWSVEPSYFFTVDPLDNRLHPASHGHGGVFFLADAGRNGSIALYFQLCYSAHQPEWCEGPIVVSSRRFSVSGGNSYRLALWFRSTIFMAVGPPQENRTRVSVRFYDSGGNDLGSDGFALPNAAPIEAWTPISDDLLAPTSAVEARIEVGIDRNHQSHVYVDDITLAPI